MRNPFTIVALAVLASLYALGILGHDLWTPDEPRVAALAKEVAEGAWVVPTLNGHPFLEQPPLHAWCVALVYRAFGIHPPEVGRIVSALFGFGGLLLTAAFASRLARASGYRGSPGRVGMLAAVALGLTFGYLTTSHRVVVDGALTFFTTASAYACLRGLAPGERAPRPLWLAAAYALASAAFLAKGLIGVVTPALAFLAVVAAFRIPRRLLEARLWLAPILFLAVTGPWFYLLYREIGALGFQEIFVDNTIGRILHSEGHRAHTRPIWDYVWTTPIHLLPATLFVLGAAIRRVRDRGRLEPGERTALDTAWLWFASGFVLLSLAATKRAVYLVPFYPPAAVAGGLWLDAWLRGAADGGYARVVGRLLAVVVALGALVLPVAGEILGGAALPGTILGAAAGLGVAWVTWRAAARGRRGAALAGHLVGVSILFLSVAWWLVPGVDGWKSLRAPALRIAAAAPADRPLFVFDPDETTEGMMPFYADRPLIVLEGREEFEKRYASAGEMILLDVAKRWKGDPPTPDWTFDRKFDEDAFPIEVLLEIPGVGYRSRTFRLLRFLPHEHPDRGSSLESEGDSDD